MVCTQEILHHLSSPKRFALMSWSGKKVRGLGCLWWNLARSMTTRAPCVDDDRTIACYAEIEILRQDRASVVRWLSDAALNLMFRYWRCSMSWTRFFGVLLFLSGLRDMDWCCTNVEFRRTEISETTSFLETKCSCLVTVRCWTVYVFNFQDPPRREWGYRGKNNHCRRTGIHVLSS